jgi:3-hydroxybutyryl-CoA dehydrogenase
MGLGIARLAEDVVVFDPDPEAGATGALEDMAGCDVVIEAAPEDLALKQELFGRLEGIVGDECVLATNTSSLLVTAIAAGLRLPERVVGMHFFNPPERMALVEIVAGEQSGPEALDRVRELARAMGRTPIDAADGPGFLVNRCNRPFNLEALRCVAEGIATPEQIDRIVTLGGGFRLGPFALMDLVGLDTSFAVQQSFFAQSFGEPRWRPAPLVGRMVAAGRLGRKTGEGFYTYPRERSTEIEPTAEPVAVAIAGDGALAAALREKAGRSTAPQARLVLCDRAPLSVLDPDGSAVGFFALPPPGRLVELTRGLNTPDAAAAAAERFFASLGMHTEWVGDAPGLVIGRIVCQLVNEACFAVAEGVGTPDDVDLGMTLGLNHPRGPLEWGDLIGPAEVVAVLRGLLDELGDPRYRVAPLLARAARTGEPLRGAGRLHR